MKAGNAGRRGKGILFLMLLLTAVAYAIDYGDEDYGEGPYGADITTQASPSYQAAGKSVMLHLTFNTTVPEEISNSNDFVASSANSTVLGITAARVFGTRYYMNFSSEEYVIEMRKPLDGRFLLAFTRGAPETISGKFAELQQAGIVGTTFGNLNRQKPDVTGIFLRLEYTDVNLLGRVYLGPGSRKIEIRNQGRDDRGITNVSIGVIT